MGCPCQNKKATSAPTASNAGTYKVRLINHTNEPSPLIGRSSQKTYGTFKNGDRVRILAEDYQASPEMFVKL